MVKVYSNDGYCFLAADDDNTTRGEENFFFFFFFYAIDFFRDILLDLLD